VDILGAYPSGHTATALVCTGTLAVLFARRHAPYRRGLTLAVTGWTTLVAWSLLWLHYHWLSDVLGGALLGVLLLWLLYRWPWYLVARPRPRSEGTDHGTGPQGLAAPRPEPDQSPAKTQDPRRSF
jgi:membrane-associated phospholipid phosphatase